ncbi:MAG TPA: hypothetical protein DCO77_03755, partial [Nitrospiraceae bacterium]|nr:hypothetical protein [Nitrospiraceae bacterium]
FNNGVNGFAPQAYPLGVGTVRTIDNENVSYQLAYTLPQNKQDPEGITVKVQSPGASLGLSYGVSDSSYDRMDINGDGLPDRVSRVGGGFLVSLNLGYRFSSTITWPSGGWGVGNISNDSKVDINADALQINENATYSLGASFWGIGGGASYTVARGIMALQDINGDGLADQILKRSDRSDNYFQVKLNRGNSFGETEQWNAPAWGRAVADGNIARWLPGENDTINYTATESYQLTAGVVIMIPLIPILTVAWIDIAPSVSLSGGEGGSALTLGDINGDGLADHVLKLKDDQGVYARVNNVGRTNLLKEVRRPLGGKFTLEYELEGNTVAMPQSQWVMTRVVLTDGMSNTYDTRYEYGDGYHDRYEREFYGFDEVTQTEARTTSIERSITQTFYNKNYYLKSRQKQSVTKDSRGAVWAKTANTYVLTDVSAGSKFPELRQTDTYYYDGTTGENGSVKQTHQKFSYDVYGNILTFVDAGELFTTSDDITATITYWKELPAYIVNKPEQLLVKDVGGATLRDRWATYEDGTGNLKTLTRQIDGNRKSKWTMTYDDYGNIKAISDPVGYTLTYTYDSEVATHVIKAEDNFPGSEGGPYYSTAVYDLKFGQVLRSTDINGNHRVNSYDDFGRPQAVFGPYSLDAGGTPQCAATIEFSNSIPKYDTEGRSVPVVPAGAVTKNRSDSLLGCGEDPIDTVTFVDGMNRLIQTKKETDVNGQHGMNVSGLVVFDALGRLVQQGQPLFRTNNRYGFEDLAAQPNQPLNPSKFIFDPVDRTTMVMRPDSSAPGGYARTTTTYGFGSVNAGGPLYAKITMIDPEGNRVNGANRRGTKVTFKDVSNNVVAAVQYNNGASITTAYGYDTLNQLTEIRDAMGNRTTIEYDLLGRRTAITNPDTGRTEYGYDAQGNLISKLTANYRQGKEIKYAYFFNRLKKIVYPFSVDVVYEYGAMGSSGNQAGRISKIIDESGVEERYYGRLGEVIKEIKQVNAKTPPVQRKTFTTEYVFDSFGRMLEMTYPDGEKQYYAYDN